MLYLLDFKVEYPAAMSQKDLFRIWAKEADAALGAKEAGVVVDRSEEHTSELQSH